MKIKEYKAEQRMTLFYYAFPEDLNFYIAFAYNEFFVSEDKEIFDKINSKPTYFKHLPEKFKEALQDPLFEIKCVKEWENAPLYGGNIKESHYFDY